MPSDKRQRQRENTRARQIAIAAAEQRSRRRRQSISIVAGAVAVIAVLYFFGPLGPSDSNGKSSTTTSAVTPTTAAVRVGDPDKCPPKAGTSKRFTTFPKAPKTCIDVNKTYTAEVKTDAGTYSFTLEPKTAPQTVNSFVFLARNHFYDGITFHRVIPGFMIQGGDPTGSGAGGPGYTIPDEFQPDHKFAIGDVAMAKTSSPNSGGSQFFVVIGPQGESLPPQYTPFGHVTNGIEVVQKIEADGSAAGTPTVVHKIISVKITEE